VTMTVKSVQNSENTDFSFVDSIYIEN